MVHKEVLDQLTSSFLEVKGVRMHYLEKGEGQPFVFLHGIPTSGYVWRHVLSCLPDSIHCIAPDLVGLGQSDKPDIAYTVFDHIEYIEAFIDSLGLESVVLVLHGWGSVIGFEYARRHEDRVKGLAFYECLFRPPKWHLLSLPVQQVAAWLFQAKNEQALIDDQSIFEELFPTGMIEELAPEDIAVYRNMLSSSMSCRVIYQFLRERPLGKGRSPEVVELIVGFSEWLKSTPIPKLLLYGIPGFVTTIDAVSWAKDNFPQLTAVELDAVMHFAQETRPELFSEKLWSWYVRSMGS